MKSYWFSLTALAVIGFAGAAYAGDAKAPKAMSDTEMDKVTAAGNADIAGEGVGTASGALIRNGQYPSGLLGNANPGFGTSTANGLGNPASAGEGIITGGQSNTVCGQLGATCVGFGTSNGLGNH